jgi:uncharacterized protein (DUF1330 family)
MESKLELEVKINKSTTISIVGSSPDIDLSTDVWAVNWFNTKRRWLYNIYSMLAAPLVEKVGGRLVLKAEFVKKIAGEKGDGRQLLLIVNYPSAHSFIELMSKGVFLFLSILRILAVNRFVFGFTKRVEIEELSPNSQAIGTPCLVHHFRGLKKDENNFKNIALAAADKSIHLAYAGTKAATLKRAHDTEGSYNVPFIMDGILVFEGQDDDALQAFAESSIYQSFTDGMEHSYSAIFRKLG